MEQTTVETDKERPKRAKNIHTTDYWGTFLRPESGGASHLGNPTESAIRGQNKIAAHKRIYAMVILNRQVLSPVDKNVPVPW